MTSQDLRMCCTRRWFDQVSPQFPNNKKNLMKVSANCFYGSYKALVYNSKPLIMLNHMKEHGNLFLHRSINGVQNQAPLPKQITE